MQVFATSQTTVKVSSFIWRTNYTQSMKEGFVLAVPLFSSISIISYIRS